MKSFVALALAISVLSLMAADDYQHGPDSMPQPGVPRGEVTKYSWSTSRIFTNTVRDYWVYVPKQYDGSQPACLMVFQDGGGMVRTNGEYRVPIVFDNLIHRGEMPITIGLFINPGDVPLKEGESPRRRPDGRPASPSNRSVEYDSLGDTYARFLLEEMIPELEKKYKITRNPEGRAICGNSSGGICAFTVAWERPDQFRKMASHIGSFTNIRGGHGYHAQIRKTERKPLRVFLQDGSGDLDNAHGNWPLANQEMAAALKFAKYDYKFVFGDGAHNGKHGGSIFPDTMRWLWRDHKEIKP